MTRFKPVPHPGLDEIAAGLKNWEKAVPDRLRVMDIGRSGARHHVLCARITDDAVPDDDKQVVLFTATHSGPELSPCTGLLKTARWLLSDEDSTREIRRKIITLICPCLNPDRWAANRRGPFEPKWENALGGTTAYIGCYTWEGLTDIEKNPEAAALVALMDEYEPDVHVDVHGVMGADYGMGEYTGMSYPWGLGRPYCSRLVREMDLAADSAGFYPILQEDDTGRVHVTHIPEGARDHFQCGRPGIRVLVFSAHRYHTISLLLESGYDESTVVRLRRCLELGTERWRGELYPGYPTWQVGAYGIMSVAAWGTNAVERRRSRVELWRAANHLNFGIGHPEPARGRLLAFCATTPQACEKFLGPGGDRATAGSAFATPMEDVLAHIREDTRFDAAAVARFLKGSPIRNALWKYAAEPPPAGNPPRNGLSLRMHIPYADAEITELRLDGHVIGPSPREGYQTWHEPGTTVQVNVRPGKVEEFHVVTCRYDTKTVRWLGFTPDDWEIGRLGDEEIG